MWKLAGPVERGRVVRVCPGGQAGDLAGVAFEAFQHGQHGQRDRRGDPLGDEVGPGVDDVPADRRRRAAADQQPPVPGPTSAASGAADDPEHAVDGRAVRHHRDGDGLPPAVAGLDPQGVQGGG